ncbi:MAG: hypothetical protein WD431_08950 [Cyclobacteriaceae bacterium]
MISPEGELALLAGPEGPDLLDDNGSVAVFSGGWGHAILLLMGALCGICCQL